MATAAAPRSMAREKIVLDDNPQTFALLRPEGGLEVGQYGSVMYTTSDDRVLFVTREDASAFHHTLQDLGIQAGEMIRVARVKTGPRGGGFAIRVARVGGTGDRPAAAPQPAPTQIRTREDRDGERLAAQLEKSIEMAQAAKGGPVAAPPARAPEPVLITPASAKLMAALKAAIDAALEATAYAARLGMKLEFSEEDVRCLAITSFIQGARA